MNPFSWPFRAQFAFGFLACAGLLGYAIYSQYQLFLDPCPLCIFQRIAFAGLGVVFLLGGLHAPKGIWGRRSYGLLALIPASIGLGIAGRHVWLTTLPEDQVPECGPPLQFMMETNPLTEVIGKVLTGSGECAKVDWTLLSLSIPEWTLLLFLGLGVLGVFGNWRRRD